MQIPKFNPSAGQILNLQDFIAMDNLAVQQGLQIKVMMEQAGYHLARVAANCSNSITTVNVGVGPGNNGGGGLVAARRLLAWGFEVSLHMIDAGKHSRWDLIELLNSQGVSHVPNWEAEIQIDAYLGFSQRLPLSSKLESAVSQMNKARGRTIVLDLPTGIGSKNMIKPNAVVCLAAPKKILLESKIECPVYIADLGIPKSVYQSVGVKEGLPFHNSSLLEWDFKNSV